MSILQFIFVSKLLIDFASTQKLVPQKVTVPSFSQYKRCTKTRTSKMYFIFSTKTFLSLTHSHLISCLLLHISPSSTLSLFLSPGSSHSRFDCNRSIIFLSKMEIVSTLFSLFTATDSPKNCEPHPPATHLVLSEITDHSEGSLYSWSPVCNWPNKKICQYV